MRKALKLSIFFCGFLLLPAIAPAQADAVARLDSAWVETGDTFVLHLAVPFSTGTPGAVDFSRWENVFPKENVLRQSGWSRVGQFWNKNLTLVYFDSAMLTLPALGIQLSGNQRALTNAVQIEVYPTKAPDDPNDLSDIKDIHREPWQWLDFLPIILIALAVALALLLYRFYYVRRKRGINSRKVELPPHQLALKKLDQLAKQQLWQQGRVKDYYAELTFILREYLEKRFGLRALESTSTEITRDLRALDVPGTLLPPLDELLVQADLAKFARGEPPRQFHEPALDHVRALVKATEPKPEPVS
jgi:hypothetical protein